MRTATILTIAYAIGLIAATRGKGRAPRAQGFPDMPMGADGMPPMNAKFGAPRSRPHMMGGDHHGNPYMPRFAVPPGLDGGADGRWDFPSDGAQPGFDPSVFARQKEMRGDFAPDDVPGGRQEESRGDQVPEEQREHGEQGWIRTGKFRKEGDAVPRKPPPGAQKEYSDYVKKQAFPDFERVRMDDRFTGTSRKPSKKRKQAKTVGTPKAPERSADGRPIMDVDTSECFRQAVKICPMRLMHENFARFTECVVEHRMSMQGACEGWAEMQGDCVADMLKHCPRLQPPTTTQCLMEKNKEKKLSEMCSKSPIFVAMTEGYEEMETKLREGYDVFGAAAASEAAAYESQHGPEDTASELREALASNDAEEPAKLAANHDEL